MLSSIGSERLCFGVGNFTLFLVDDVIGFGMNDREIMSSRMDGLQEMTISM